MWTAIDNTIYGVGFTFCLFVVAGGIAIFVVWYLDRKTCIAPDEATGGMLYEHYEPAIDDAPVRNADLRGMTVNQLLDAALDSRARAAAIEAVFCHRFGIDPNNDVVLDEDSNLYDAIVAAVWDCRGWDAFRILYHQRVDGTRWHPSTSRARAVV